MVKKLLVSQAPHLHGKENTRRIMLDVLIALIPAVLVSVYFMGLSALSVFAVSIATCVAVEYLIQRYLINGPSTISDMSALLTAVLLALNLPPTSPWWMVMIGAVVAIGIAKMTFGGLGNNLFNPALVGRVVLLISFPVLMTDWTVPPSIFRVGADAISGATPLGIIKEGLAGGLTMEQLQGAHGFSYQYLLWGKIGGSMGEANAFALLLGFAYLLYRKVIRLHIPLTIFVTVALFTGILWLINPQQNADPLFHLLTGGILLGAIFMATDYVTSPMSTKGMIIFGVGIGVITVLIRVYGAYPEGISFAILIMNAMVPLLNMYCKPKRFGEVIKNG
ncbi:MAG: RnfABCDGE type electron transport complex subunit D [Bacteroidales bacterium]|nr:RnfABCDGE type electron transport complex subunit D [Bacteroidales bacterium]MCL2738155.1 RnfABCDGE type electron transport complex subunit D [Bacteroidales bacterium]